MTEASTKAGELLAALERELNATRENLEKVKQERDRWFDKVSTMDDEAVTAQETIAAQQVIIEQMARRLGEGGINA